MSERYTKPVETVLRIIGNARNCGTIFETESDISAIRSAIGYGLLRLVPSARNAFQLSDTERGENKGIELTSHGMKFLGIDEYLYHRH